MENFVEKDCEIMKGNEVYSEFLQRFKLLVSKKPWLIENTLSNIFTMRLIGNKTHGDLAEVGISEFINQFMYDYDSKHVGKDLFRAKKKEEDITITNRLTGDVIPLSLKAYGAGPLQLSTDKEFKLFPLLSNYRRKHGDTISDRKLVNRIFSNEAFNAFFEINVMPLIYKEADKKCCILVFDAEKAKRETASIVYHDSDSRRKHPVFVFQNKAGEYICEVRYGGAAANALQRGLWTHTKNAKSYMNFITDWIDYRHNKVLVKLFALALNATQSAHERSIIIMQNDIEAQQK